ncbi:hypothetical protein N7481_004156 [Penicillium waksmanii]|uniref:uncharacterized protein n=1 Tax=Penicillium waksmanii TaxID=69791 RepID=UPI0025484336|nr:uncharacterized protein N7481_004156 [Penicillium waksmanii]KAJ5988946.1 hypothetical protein N7481_004156 [Penicillium waksmanii]
MSQFQLFPPPSPEVRAQRNPFRKGAKKPVPKNEPPSPIPLEEIKSSSNTESVLLQIIEDTQQFPPPPALPATNFARSKSPATQSSQRSRSPQSPRNRRHQNTSPMSHRPLPSQGSAGDSSSNNDQNTNSTTSPQSSQSSVSPLPMRSMFPRFDPKTSLNTQNNDSQMPTEAPKPKRNRRPNLTLTTTSDIDHVLGPKTVPASVFNFPTGALEPEEIRYSSVQELEMLWEAANGQRPRNPCGTVNLRLTRTGPATFTFGNSSQPFYSLQTYSNNEIAISRGAPSNPESDIPIMGLSLEERRRREHPNDGLVALLFSRLAAMLAIEQAAEVSKEHQLTPSEAGEIERNALKRAAAQESCRLSWNRNLRLYELRHPSLSKRQPPALVGAAGIPLSPVRSQSSGMLHIAVSAPSSDAVLTQPPTIIVTGPVSMEAAQQAATARTSILPVTDSDEPLAALDLATRTLSISPAAVIATIPSLYAIDSLVAAMLAVAVSDEITNPILADMEIGSTHHSFESSMNSEPMVGVPYRGRLVTTLAEREDYAESLHLASQIEDANAKAEAAAKRKSLFKFWERIKPSSSSSVDGRTAKKGKNKDQQVVVEEFDLEKYGRYGPESSRKGEKMPGITRTILKLLFWGLELFVKGLTLAVKLLAWLLVRATRCVTSEKF